MGEMVDMILDGDMCQECGQFIGGGSGFPQTCVDCLAVDGFVQAMEAEMVKSGVSVVVPAGGPSERKPFLCGCGKRFTTARGMAQHKLDVHGEA